MGNFGECRSCKARIWWGQTVNGARMPVDPKGYRVVPCDQGPLNVLVSVMVPTIAGGEKRAKTIRARPATPEDKPEDTVMAWDPHWATCQHRQKHKRKKAQAAA